MQHYITWPTSSTFACGSDATGQRNSRLDPNPALTTCTRCRETAAWQEACGAR